MSAEEVTVSVDLAAQPQHVWRLVSNPVNYVRWSPEATAVRRRSGSGPWRAGDQFDGTNRVWLPWTTRCTVVVADEPREFAFDVDFGPFPVARWAYEVTATDTGCTVTERWTDRREGLLGALVKPSGLFVGRGRDAAARNRMTMTETLAGLKAQAETASA